MNPVWLLQLTGVSLISLAMLHLVFPRWFHWAEELPRLSPLNRQIFLVHCFFICLVLVLMGSLLLIWPELLLRGGDLARVVSGGLCLFWGSRLAIQWFGYTSDLWWRKPAETLIHGALTVLWTFYSAVFGWLAWHA